MVNVNEVFATIQGEAHWTGTPSIFVRLQYCPIGCPWCDTKYTWSDETVDAPLDDLFFRIEETNGIKVDEDTLLQSIEQRWPTIRHIVITGGEPCAQDINKLCELAHGAGYTTQVETSGTFPVIVPDSTWVTLSPKIGMPNGYEVRRDALHRANEVKHPVGKMDDLHKLAVFLGSYQPPLVWLQPLSQSEKATALCVDACMNSNNYRLSAQVHKFLNLP